MSIQARALIVDDEPDILELLDITLARMDVDCVSAANLSQARAALQEQNFGLCLTDMRLPDGDGIELVTHISANFPHLPVAVITAHGSMQTAIEAMKAGAFDFVSKPVDLTVLRHLVSTALKLKSPSAPQGRSPLLGKSAPMEQIRRLIAKVARSQAPVYVGGESGTGKELVARMIHEQGPRAERNFIAVNCGAIPHDLVESELFGYRKGSFTGAQTDKIGLFQAAEGGTLFLDEIADLPMDMQVKLLRAIQEKSVRPIGASNEIPIDTRIISATHKDLASLVEQGRFRQDLFYRINVIELPLPPLRERREDLPELTAHFLQRIARQSGCSIPEMTAEAVSRLKEYHFPGNVRELENILERAIALCENAQLSVEDLHLSAASPPPPASSPPPASLGKTAEPAAQGQALEAYLSDIERQTILQTLEETRWNRTAAARKLGMSLRSLRYRLEKLGLN